MTTSGTNTFIVSANDIYTEALSICGVQDPGVALQAADITTCAMSLNIMCKSMVMDGLPLWTVKEITVPMVNGVSSYPIGNTAGYLYSATISSPGTGGSAGTYALGISGGGGSGATGTYTISGGGVTAITITAGGNSFTSAPTLSFPSGGVSGVVATANIVGLTTDRPLRILQAFIRDSNGNDTILTVESRYEYNLNGYKPSPSTPNQLFYDPQLSNGVITVFGVPPDSTSSIHLVIQRQFQDFNATTDNPDFTQEAYLMLTWGLADMISLKYRVQRDVRAEIGVKAKYFKDQFFAFQQDYVPITVVPGESSVLDNYSSTY